jgi:hypothetical protein
MIKFFYVNGDSFSFGQELDGPRDPSDFFTFSEFQRKNCYSGLIADKLGLEYKNNSQPGGSNQRIYRTMLSDLTELLKTYKPEEIFVNISLTHCIRREFYSIERDTYYPHMNTVEPQIEPDRSLWKLLVTDFSNLKSELERDQLIILGIQNFLRVNKIPYLLTWSFHHGSMYDDEKAHISPAILDQRYLKRFYQHPSFNIFSFNNKFPTGPGKHPLLEGHRAWADHLLTHIEKNNLFDNSDL